MTLHSDECSLSSNPSVSQYSLTALSTFPDLKDDVTNVGNKSGQGLVLFVRGGSGLFLVLKDISREIRESVEQLSEFLGAKVVYSRKVPEYWHSHLH